jgi:Protein phosphatase 2C
MHMPEALSLNHLQVTILGRHEQDELLLLASDGLWDVLSNQVWRLSHALPLAPSPLLRSARCTRCN